MQVFDGHNDLLSRLWRSGGDPMAEFAKPIGHINADAVRAGGLGGGFFALYSPDKRATTDFTALGAGDLDIPLPPTLDEGDALVSVIGQVGIAQHLQRAGVLVICTDAESLARAFVGDGLAGILHLEGADCIGPDLLALDTLYALGLRSLGPVWSRPTIFGEGVPFAFNKDGDTGAGLTPDGHRLIARCKALGVMIDTSHLTMKGFWDVAEAGVPLVATHSNAHAICPTTRNLTDAQLKAVGETGGMVGLNFATPFLSEAGWTKGTANIEDCLRQLDHMINLAGEDHVALGSDFDGAPTPDDLQTAADLPNLIGAMRSHGYGEALVAKLAHENWLGFLGAHFEGGGAT